MKAIALTLKTLILALCLAGASHAAPTTGTVNINTADAATLDRLLDGVGPSKAQAIITYRKANGPFRSAADLAKVKGIGEATVKRNVGRISVGARPAAPAAAKKTPAR